MTIPNTQKRLAVLFDAENVPSNYLQQMLNAIKPYGTAMIKRAYGDWTLLKLQVWREALLKHDIVPIQTLQVVAGKNLSNIAMSIEAMDIMYSEVVDGICIVSSDSDFTPLVHRLRDQGLFVMGVGQQNTPTPFMGACDTFLIVDKMVQQKTSRFGRSSSGSRFGDAMPTTSSRFGNGNNNNNDAANSGTSSSSRFGGSSSRFGGNPSGSTSRFGSGSAKKRVVADTKRNDLPELSKSDLVLAETMDDKMKRLGNLLVQAITIASPDNQWVTLSTLGINLRKVDPEFKIKSYGFSALGKAVEAFPKLFKIEVQNNTKRVQLLIKS